MILAKHLTVLSVACLLASPLAAQDPSIRLGGEIPAEVDKQWAWLEMEEARTNLARRS